MEDKKEKEEKIRIKEGKVHGDPVVILK